MFFFVLNHFYSLTLTRNESEWKYSVVKYSSMSIQIPFKYLNTSLNTNQKHLKSIIKFFF